MPKPNLWEMAEGLGNRICSPDQPSEDEISIIHGALEWAYVLGSNVAYQSMKQSAEFHLENLPSKET